MKSHEDYSFWVYILSNRSHILYIGVTNSLRNRVMYHRKLTPETFTARYKLTRLVYCEQFQYINNAIAREKELKHWTRAQKIALIEVANPTWEDLMHEVPSPFVNSHKRRFPSGMTNKKATGNTRPVVIPERNRPLHLHSLSPLLFPLSFPQGVCVFSCICCCFTEPARARL